MRTATTTRKERRKTVRHTAPSHQGAPQGRADDDAVAVQVAAAGGADLEEPGGALQGRSGPGSGTDLTVHDGRGLVVTSRERSGFNEMSQAIGGVSDQAVKPADYQRVP